MFLRLKVRDDAVVDVVVVVFVVVDFIDLLLYLCSHWDLHLSYLCIISISKHSHTHLSDITTVSLSTGYIIPEYGIDTELTIVIINTHTRRSFVNDVLPQIRACNADVKVSGLIVA